MITLTRNNPYVEKEDCIFLIGQSNASPSFRTALATASGITTFQKNYGGNSITKWWYDDERQTNLTNDLLYYNSDIREDYNIKYLIMFQGEADMFSQTNAEQHKALTLATFDYIKYYIKYRPQYIYVAEIWRDTANPDYNTYMEIVRNGQVEMGQEYSYITTFETKDYARVDDVHLSSTGQTSLANAMFP